MNSNKKIVNINKNEEATPTPNYQELFTKEEAENAGEVILVTAHSSIVVKENDRAFVYVPVGKKPNTYGEYYYQKVEII